MTTDIDTSEELRRLERLYKHIASQRPKDEVDKIERRLRLANIAFAMDLTLNQERDAKQPDKLERMMEEGWR